jgi:pimeloyl-ACP methyl ester carboxylesterase
MLALLIIGLAGLGSYDLEASKPRTPNLPIARICPHRIQMLKEGVAVQIPLCLSAPSLETANPSITTAIIVIHGNVRNAVGAEAVIEAALTPSERRDVLVAAPQFLTPVDVQGQDTPADLAIWRNTGWSQGDRSEGAAPVGRPSSFEVVDRLVEEIGRAHRYPNLKTIVVVGHSAGGQFVQRYAAGTRIEQHPSLAARHLAFRYVAANPSSYLSLFPRPPDALTERCSRYDAYKYGLTDLNVYLRPLGPDGIRNAYAQKNVTILLGRLDFDSQDPALDASCGAMIQGANRLNRGIRFVHDLDSQYGVGLHHTKIAFVPGVGHNARGMFGSPSGRTALLGGVDGRAAPG